MFEKWMHLLAFIVLSSSLGAQTNLTKVIYHQGMAADQIICLFDDMPSCIYEPRLSHDIRNHDTRDSNHADFFLPLTTINSSGKQDSDYLRSLSNKHFSIDVERVNNPVQGIKIHIRYNPHQVVFEYQSCSGLLLQKAIIFNFYDKKNLPLLTTDKSALRWCKNSVHQPRVAINLQAPANCRLVAGFQDQNSSNFAQSLMHALTNAGCEVMITTTTESLMAETNRVNCANMIVQADLLITLDDQHNKSADDDTIATYVLNRKALLLKHSWATSAEAACIEQFYEKLQEKSLSCAQQVHKELAYLASDHNKKIMPTTLFTTNNQMLIGAQMPAIALALSSMASYPRDRLVAALCKGVMAYFQATGFCSR